MRGLKRSVAKANMQRAGLARLAKGGTFRKCWRDWVSPSVGKRKPSIWQKIRAFWRAVRSRVKAQRWRKHAMTAAEIRRLPIGAWVRATEIRRDARGDVTYGISRMYEVGIHETKRVLKSLPSGSSYLPIRDYKNCVFEVAKA